MDATVPSNSLVSNDGRGLKPRLTAGGDDAAGNYPVSNDGRGLKHWPLTSEELGEKKIRSSAMTGVD